MYVCKLLNKHHVYTIIQAPADSVSCKGQKQTYCTTSRKLALKCVICDFCKSHPYSSNTSQLQFEFMMSVTSIEN